MRILAKTVVAYGWADHVIYMPIWAGNISGRSRQTGHKIRNRLTFFPEPRLLPGLFSLDSPVLPQILGEIHIYFPNILCFDRIRIFPVVLC